MGSDTGAGAGDPATDSTSGRPDDSTAGDATKGTRSTTSINRPRHSSTGSTVPSPSGVGATTRRLDYDSLRVSLLSSDHATALYAVQSLRDQIEIVHIGAEFSTLLQTLLPALSAIVTERTRPNPRSESTENRLRHAVVEILSKFPHNETLRPRAEHLLDLVMTVLTKDYEENALLAGRMVFDLHKNFRPGLGDAAVQPFLDFVMSCYRGLGGSVIQNFGSCTVERYLNTGDESDIHTDARPTTNSSGSAAMERRAGDADTAISTNVISSKTTAAPDASAESHVNSTGTGTGAGAGIPSNPARDPPSTPRRSSRPTTSGVGLGLGLGLEPSETPRALPSSSPRHASTPSAQGAASAFNPPAFRSVSSFKVLTECPLTVMLLFQLHPACMKYNIPLMIPLMMECLSIQGPSSKEYEYKGGGSQLCEMENVDGGDKMEARDHQEEEGAFMIREGAGGLEEEATKGGKEKREKELLGALPSGVEKGERDRGGTTEKDVVEENEMSSADGNRVGNRTAGMKSERKARGSQVSSLNDASHRAAVDIIQSLALRYHARLSRDLMAAQVKTLSFLTYLLRGYGNEMIPYTDRIASSVVYLLKTCPRDALSTRKELLVATRHILATDFRSGFYRRIDALLDDRILVGTGRPASSDILALRPLGYSTLADLVHHVRSNLSMAQVNRVVSIFGRVLHDAGGGLLVPRSSGGEPSWGTKSSVVAPTESVGDGESAAPELPIVAHPSPNPPTTRMVIFAVPVPPLPLPVRITSVRLLLNLVDHVYQNRERDAQFGRDVLYRILDILVRTLENLKEWGVSGLFALEEVSEGAGGGGGKAVEDKGVDDSPTESERVANSTNKGVSGNNDIIFDEMTSGAMDDGSGKNENKDSGVTSRDDKGEGYKGRQDAAIVNSRRPHEKQERGHAYLRSSASIESSYLSDRKFDGETRCCGFVDPALTHEQLYSIQSLVRPIVVGIKTLLWSINTYGSQRERARRDLQFERRGPAATNPKQATAEGSSESGKRDAIKDSAGSDKSKQRKKSKTGDNNRGQSSKRKAAHQLGDDEFGTSTMGSEDSPLAIQKLTNAERELIDRFFIASLGCLEVFRPQSGEFVARSSKETTENCDELIDFGRWPSRHEVLRRQGYNTDSSHGESNSSAIHPLLVLPLERPFLREQSFHFTVPETSQPYQTMLETLAATYLVLDPYNMRRIVGPRLDVLFDAIVTDPVNFQFFFSHLLLARAPSGGGKGEGDGRASGTYEFCDLLLEYLNARLNELGTEKVIPLQQFLSNDGVGDKKDPGAHRYSGTTHLLRRRKAACIIRLFELCLSSISSCPKNEGTLRPKLRSIVTTSLRQSMAFCDTFCSESKRNPFGESGSAFTGYNYLYLLRSIFRTVSGGKFEESYKAMYPLVSSILNGLWRIYSSVGATPMPSLVPDPAPTSTCIVAGDADREDLLTLRHIIIDLCLTIPARLSSLLPHLPLLVRIIVPALSSESGDLVNLG